MPTFRVDFPIFEQGCSMRTHQMSWSAAHGLAGACQLHNQTMTVTAFTEAA